MSHVKLMRLALTLALLACPVASSARPHAPPPSMHDDLTLGDKDDGRKITLSSGDILTVRLAAQPGTGFGWRVVSPNSRRLKLLGSSTERGDAGGEAVAEFQVFRFEARSHGSHTLRLHYARPWKKNDPLKTFSLDVTVRRA